MKITLDYRNPTLLHCNVAVFINGANAGTLTLRQDEIVHFQTILHSGLCMPGDELFCTGNPDPHGENAHDDA